MQNIFIIHDNKDFASAFLQAFQCFFCRLFSAASCACAGASAFGLAPDPVTAVQPGNGGWTLWSQPVLDPGKDVVLNFAAADLLEDAVAEAGVGFAGDVGEAGVLFSGEEENGEGGDSGRGGGLFFQGEVIEHDGLHEQEVPVEAVAVVGTGEREGGDEVPFLTVGGDEGEGAVFLREFIVLAVKDLRVDVCAGGIGALPF